MIFSELKIPIVLLEFKYKKTYLQMNILDVYSKGRDIVCCKVKKKQLNSFFSPEIR
jgi:hypothetical protein